jgi:hypothetical protein
VKKQISIHYLLKIILILIIKKTETMKKNAFMLNGIKFLLIASIGLVSCRKETLNPADTTIGKDAESANGESTIQSSPSAYQANYFYSYEGSLQSWTKDATDLELAGGEIEWHIIPKTTLPYQGYYSLEYYLNNLNDAGKIWVEKSFTVPANRTYKVDVSYKFASNDWGDVNNFVLLTGASTSNPEVADDLTTQETTYNGGVQNYVWLGKSFSFNVTATALGKLWIHVGVWGNWETPRTYYYDNVCIKITQV